MPAALSTLALCACSTPPPAVCPPFQQVVKAISHRGRKLSR